MSTLEKIRAEIQKVLDKERDFTSENVKAQALALMWVLELINKYAEQEPTYNKLSFPNTFDELVEQYGITDTDEVYTNGSKLIPAFRVKQWLIEANINGYTEGLSETVTEFADRCRECGKRYVKRKTGHWEKIVKEHKCYARDDTYTTTEYHCSECGAEPLAEYASDGADYAFSNFCPNCGADMRGEPND